MTEPGAADIREACRELAAAVDGVDWNAERVVRARDAVSSAVKKATAEDRDAAFRVLLARLDRARVEDADGVAHVAITAGAMVENGAPARELGDVLLRKITDVLRAARGFADACLRDTPADVPAKQTIARVDDRAIGRDVFRAHLASDRGGGAALARLREWTLPTIAALTRDRPALERAASDDALKKLAASLRSSDAHWLHVLLGVTLRASVVALHPPSMRGFRMVLDGVVSNFDLRALVEDMLMERGLPGRRNPPEVLAVVRGERERAGRNFVEGAFNLYTFRGARYDLADSRSIPLEHWVWNEGAPNDIPRIDGSIVLVAGPQAPARSWNAQRVFGALRASIELENELARDEVERWLATCSRMPAE